jgi:adenylate kinase
VDQDGAVDAPQRFGEAEPACVLPFGDDQAFMVLERDTNEVAARTTDMVRDQRVSKILGNTPNLATNQVAWALRRKDDVEL